MMRVESDSFCPLSSPEQKNHTERSVATRALQFPVHNDAHAILQNDLIRLKAPTFSDSFWGACTLHQITYRQTLANKEKNIFNQGRKFFLSIGLCQRVGCLRLPPVVIALWRSVQKNQKVAIFSSIFSAVSAALFLLQTRKETSMSWHKRITNPFFFPYMYSKTEKSSYEWDKGGGEQPLLRIERVFCLPFFSVSFFCAHCHFRVREQQKEIKKGPLIFGSQGRKVARFFRILSKILTSWLTEQNELNSEKFI